ncbi:hypothetical protein FQA39_LY09205 [Lamprigera yunnana]|nr:hypothetical protein FQA39_LY09205 [Lamprigera yunnana]
MASYKIVASYLEVDELQYELKKKGFTTTCNVQLMRIKLCQNFGFGNLDKTIIYPKCTVVFDDEVNPCEEKLNVLKDKISIFTCDSSCKELLVLDSRLSHLMCRFDNIPMTNVDEKNKTRCVGFKGNRSFRTAQDQINLSHNDTVSFLIILVMVLTMVRLAMGKGLALALVPRPVCGILIWNRSTSYSELLVRLLVNRIMVFADMHNIIVERSVWDYSYRNCYEQFHQKYPD